MEYLIKGAYFFHEQENFHSGKIIIDENNLIKGEIVDPKSISSSHEVSGKIFRTDDSYNLKFIKNPRGLLIPILYTLKKSDGDDSIEGEYKGIWEFGEGTAIQLMQKIDSQGNNNIFSVRETDTTNKTKLTLERKV